MYVIISSSFPLDWSKLQLPNSGRHQKKAHTTLNFNPLTPRVTLG